MAVSRKNRVIFTLVLLSLFFSITVPNAVSLVEEKSISDLTKDSDNIITGKVLGKESYWENGNIFTNVIVSADRHIKGNSGNQVTVKVRGGTVGDIYAEVSDVPLFDDNEEVLLFLKGDSVVGWNQGKYSIQNDMIKETGDPLVEFINNIEQNLGTGGIYKNIDKNVDKNIDTRGDTGRYSDVTSAKLDIKSMMPVHMDSSISTSIPLKNDALTSPVKYEGFESAFPNNWYLSGNPTWCNSQYKAYAGKWSGWNACGGTAGVASDGLYSNNMDARMIYGPFSLVGVTNPLLTFQHFTDTEIYNDRFSYMASIDGVNFYGMTISGNWTPWESATFDLKNVYTLGDLRGQPNVWIAFIFTSDSSVQDYGVFLDEINLVKDATSSLAPHITSVTPKSGPARAMELGSSIASSNSTQVTISGSAFGSTKGSVKFWRVGTTQYDATIVSWTNTKIVAKVPGRVSSGVKYGGYGNVQVFTSDGTPSDNYGNFNVTYSYGGGKLPGNKIIYMVNTNNVGSVNILPAIQAATDTWNNAGANFGFVYGALSSKTDVAMDGENSLMWVNYDTGSVATTTTWWSGTDTKTIIESDIAFNDLNIKWATDGSLDKMDVQTVTTHEFGHWLQLLDLYGSTDSKKVMYGYGGNGGMKRTLDVNDIAGMRWIYGNNSSVPTDIIPPVTTLNGATEGVTYKDNVTIELVAKDNTGGSGVVDTMFTVNSDPVAIYSTPFVVSNEGQNTVIYNSIDNAGNVEESKQVNFTINKVVVGDMLTYYRGLGTNPNVVETTDLLTAANDWRDNIIPPGFYASITTSQLLTLANEWRNS